MLENQDGLSQENQEIQKIIELELLKAKKAFLNDLVRLEILNYSRHDGVYFKELNGRLIIVSGEIDV
jgi:hypothetical protein